MWRGVLSAQPVFSFPIGQFSDVTFISIRNNPKLKRFLWNSSQNLRIATNNQELYVLVYNNPLLDGNATRMINDTIARSNRTNIKSYIQSGPHGSLIFLINRNNV